MASALPTLEGKTVLSTLDLSLPQLQRLKQLFRKESTGTKGDGASQSPRPMGRQWELEVGPIYYIYEEEEEEEGRRRRSTPNLLSDCGQPHKFKDHFFKLIL